MKIKTINIDKLTEEELIDLNHRIVERLRFMRHARAHAAMLRFSIGDRVTFEPDNRGPVFGIIVRYNKKSVSVVTEDGQRWTVTPSLLHHAPSVEAKPSPSGKVVALPQKPRNEA